MSLLVRFQKTVAAGVFLLLASLGFSAPSSANLLKERWPASWITHPDAPAREYGVLFFRRVLVLPQAPASFLVHVSADERYRLLVNGAEVSCGPARGDLLNWRYETVDLAPHLRAGSNVVAALVWKFADAAPWAQATAQLGFIIQGAETISQMVNSGTGWQVLRSEAHRPEPLPLERKPWIPASYGERIDGTKYPWGWDRADFNPSGWSPAKSLGQGSPKGMRDGGTFMGWLVPRRIPLLEQRPQRITRLARATGIETDGKFLDGQHPLTIPAHAQVELLLDQACLTVAYPELVLSGGRGAEVRVTYAEALFDAKNKKGNRDEIAGRKIVGLSDLFLPDGGAKRTFRPSWLRTWRYVQLNIRTAEKPLTLEDIQGVFSAYPFAEQAAFDSSDPSLKRIWNTGWRTARLCAGETFFDCPYYEQLQYIGDTRVEALITLSVSGDDRLMRNAILDFYASRVPEGLTASRHPSREMQLIPPYSLFWIAMLHDHWMHRGDASFLKPLLGGADDILRWYELRLATNGLCGPMEWWNFTDWCDRWARGEPPAAAEGGSGVLTIQFVYAAQLGAELFDAFGEPDRAAHWRKVANQAKQALNTLCWDKKKELYADTAAKNSFSQHLNILAVLTGTCDPRRSRNIMEKVLGDSSLTPCTLYFRFYLHRALEQVGLGDRYLAQLKPWHDMLAIGLTTFAEKPEPSRSDCHAWSACPNYDFLELVCGIKPASPGFKTVRISPALGELKWASARLPHPNGIIEVRFERRGEKAISADITLPQGLSGEFIWSGKSLRLKPGKQHLEK